MTCTDCAVTQFPITAWCNNDNNEQQNNVQNLSIATRDTYSIVLARVNASQVGKKVYVTSRVVLNRTRYYTDDAIESCHDTDECTVDLGYGTDRGVVVEIGANSQVYDAYFDTECQERIILWVGVFLLVPGFLILGLLVVLTVGEIYLKRRQARSADTDNTQTSSQGYAKMNDADELVN